MQLRKYLQRIFGSEKINILDSSSGSQRWENITNILSDYSEGEVIYLERNKQRSESAKRSMGNKIRIINNKIEWYGTNQSFDLIYYDILPRDLSIFISHIFPCITEMISKGNIIIINIPISQKNKEVISRDGQLFDKFLDKIQTNQVISSIKTIINKMIHVDEIEEISPENHPIANFSYKTLAIKVSGAALDFPEGRCPYVSDSFSMNELVSLLEKMKSSVNFCLLDKFLDSLEQGNRSKGVFHCIKHDIHHDLLSAYRIAKKEALLNISATFFIMHPHKLSQNYINLQETLDVLLDIQSLGHEIGIHVDPLNLELEKGDFFNQLEAFLKYLRSSGIKVRTGNTHGNTDYKDFKEYGGNIIFKEAMELKEQVNSGSSALIRQISLIDVYKRLNLEYWFDSVIFDKGDPVRKDMLMIGDNYHRFDLYKLTADGGFNSKLLLQGKEWSIDDKLENELFSNIYKYPCIYLFHPQFYK